ncbi:MAG: hypothetical protein HY831_04000 [Candidatus Aenigmarchaeota archaeon]|nr:hypothetical protein [Candidatus Aenigmarchaeota archaeon]
MDIYSNIKSMKIQGASQIAIQEILHLRDFAKKHGFGQEFEIECKYLMNIRKTAVVSNNVITELLKDRSLENIVYLIEQLKNSRQKIAKNAKVLFKGKKTIMTHCHSHEATDVFLENKLNIKEIYVTETRPFGQGLLTANDLKRKMRVNYIVDSSEGFYMPEVDFVLVGADALRKEGLVNKIGTLQLCILAKEYGKKVYVAADTFKIDNRKKIDIEFRNPEEISKPIKGVKILNPVFDITKWKYVDKIITEKGILNSKQLRW